MASGNGALKSELIDVSSSDECIAQFLNNTIHAGLQSATMTDRGADVLPDMEEPEEISGCLPHLCKTNQLFELASHFVRKLQKELEQRKIYAGSLLTLSADGNPVTHAFFLGIALNKPLVQTVVMARIEDDQVTFLQTPGSLVPEMATTHDLLLKMLEVSSTTLDSLSVEHWHYIPLLSGAKSLRVNADCVAASFEISRLKTKASSSVKPAARMPFGFKPERKPRKKKPTGERKKAASKKRKAQPTSQDHQLVIAEDDGMAKEDSDSDVGSSSSSSSTAAINDKEEKSHPSHLGHEDNEVQPISETMQKETIAEQEVIQEIAQTEENIEELQKGIAKSDDKSDKSAKPTTANKKEPSFFSKRLGLGVAGVSPTARAKCHHCRNLIPKGAVRFEWMFNRLKPNGWLHSYCLIECAQKYELVEDTIQNLREVRASFSSGSQSESPVNQEVARILAIMTA